MNDKYGVLSLPTHLGNIIDSENNQLKPFVAVYFPEEILVKMGWTRETNLILSVEKDSLKIAASGEPKDENYFRLIGELTYEPIDEES